MPLSPLHHQVASIALGAAAGHGFALGGGNALLAHGVITRPTQDVDLFTDREHGVEAAAGAVEAALRDADGRLYRSIVLTSLAEGRFIPTKHSDEESLSQVGLLARQTARAPRSPGTETQRHGL